MSLSAQSYGRPSDRFHFCVIARRLPGLAGNSPARIFVERVLYLKCFVMKLQAAFTFYALPLCFTPTRGIGSTCEPLRGGSRYVPA